MTDPTCRHPDSLTASDLFDLVASHEAGHAYAAWARLGIAGVRHVRVASDGSGRTEHGQTGPNPDSAFVTYAGPWAQARRRFGFGEACIACGKTFEHALDEAFHNGGDDDLAMMREWSAFWGAAFVDDWPDLRAAWNRQLEGDWPIISALASALVRAGGSLYGVDAVAVLQSARLRFR